MPSISITVEHATNSDAKAAAHTGLLMQAYASLLTQLAEMPHFLQHSVSTLAAARLLQMPAQDKFPLIEHLWHIRDCDVDLYAHRIRQVLQHDKPGLEPVDVGACTKNGNTKTVTAPPPSPSLPFCAQS